MSFCASLYCQSQSESSIYSHKESRNEDFATVIIDLKHFVELEVSTSSESGFYITDEKQSGEYKDALILNTKVVNDTLFVTDPLNPTFEFPQDKLSAHKITDTKAILILPINKDAFFNLSNANLHLKGKFENVIVNIHSGNVYLTDLYGDLQITSVNADITSEGLNDYSFEATSRNGRKKIDNSHHNRRYLLKVESINGNIHLK